MSLRKLNGGMMLYYSDNNLNKYKIPNSINLNEYIRILFNGMEIKWVLQTFNIKEAYEISRKVLELTKHTEYYALNLKFVCEDEKEIVIIYNILYEEYRKSKLFNVNLLEISIQQFLKSA